jgi:hypothetical protein
VTPFRTLSLLALSALLAAGCETANQKGFTVPGCYDYRGILEPSIHTVAECEVQGWEWHTQDWKKRVPAKPPPRSTR